MGGHQGRQLASKWAKTAALLSHPDIAPHIPPTSILTAENLRSMLDTHQTVVVKPVVGAGGHGVMRVVRNPRGYAYTYYAQTRHFHSFAALVGALNKRRRGKAYLIQKGIRLATVGNRPIDYRVKYVKTENGWVYRAIVGRIAKPGLFVTNLCRGGTLVTSAQGISRSLSPSLVAEKKAKMRELTVLATGVLEAKYPGIGQLGFDYGIDKQGMIWIFEVNTRPQ
ncbi:YheC/YheD family protein [Paenibacillus arenilitoris]|uniref:YheC/YheD family protein n=1 Tax=Paenibacillus arenilitoris TaxID=2772299 RepID=A0A927CJA3_9BACL|nr:YheC/YheD family protein [Paenibacillus arenilitoris]MBD2868122.1 YheC/YheD family protein [Paenibacillus arenilitoris]